MAASLQDDVSNLAHYLCVSCGKLTFSESEKILEAKLDGVQLQGLVTIVKYIVRKSQHKNLLGRTSEERALVDQWLEFRVNRVDRCSGKTDIYLVLKELNVHLRDRAYLVSWQPTLADIILYYSLHCVMIKLEHVDRQKYMNVSRWFDHIQHLPGVQQKLPHVMFIRNTIYTTFGH